MSESTDPFVHSDAAYVLGALSSPDRQAYEEHLASCHRCSNAVAELAGMPAMLRRTTLDTVEQLPHDPGPVPDTVLAGAVAAVRRERRRRLLLGVGGAVAAAALVFGVTVATQGGPGAPEPEGIVMVAVRQSPVTARVEVTPVAWGTKVELYCAYGSRSANSPPYDPSAPAAGAWSSPYRLMAVPRDGGPVQQIAEWKVTPGRAVVVGGSTDLAAADIETLQMVAADGTVLLTAPATGG